MPHLGQNFHTDLLALKHFSQRFQAQAEREKQSFKNVDKGIDIGQFYLARKAAMLMLRLVSGVTISVLEKSIEPSPGWGMGYPTPTPLLGATKKQRILDV